VRAPASSSEGDPSSREPIAFSSLALSEPVLAALNDVGYESPSPIQAATIPHILAGTDVVGQAQTGTGKTAAFALPILSKIDIAAREPQALVLVPTRELAIQVAEAFKRYATHMPGFHVLPIYGGQSYTPQLQSLRRGVHVIVGTPGRVMDHLKRETLKLGTLKYLVLDEADEMLRMGFIEDVEWILEQTPEGRQIALFSATMPAAVRRIAQNHLNRPAEVTIRNKTSTAASIRQRYWMVSGMHKLDALTRILEAEPFDAMIVFARTKQATAELTERLEARGFAVEALNGDIPQPLRERTIARLKSGQIDIVVATDVAARGLDVERVSHVVNFDVPYDPESYVHRIGRTGRAGRSGEAILFIAPRERNMLRVIERATRQPITQMELPTVEDVNEQRVIRFNQRITEALAAGEAHAFRALIERYEQSYNVPAVEIAAALASIAQGKTPLLLETGRRDSSRSERAPRAVEERTARKSLRQERKPYASEARPSEPVGREGVAEKGKPDKAEHRQTEHEVHAPAAPVQTVPHGREDREVEAHEAAAGEPAAQGAAPREVVTHEAASREVERHEAKTHQTDQQSMDTDGRQSEQHAVDERSRGKRTSGSARREFESADAPRNTRREQHDDESMLTYRVEVGEVHGVKPSNIVGAIANEAGLEGRYIGRVVIMSDHSFVDLPGGMPKEIFRELQKVRVGGQQLQISLALRTQVEKLRRERGPAGGRERKPGGFARDRQSGSFGDRRESFGERERAPGSFGRDRPSGTFRSERAPFGDRERKPGGFGRERSSGTFGSKRESFGERARGPSGFGRERESGSFGGARESFGGRERKAGGFGREGGSGNFGGERRTAGPAREQKPSSFQRGYDRPGAKGARAFGTRKPSAGDKRGKRPPPKR